MGKAGDGSLTPLLARAGRARLRILATSDVHAHLVAWDYHNDTAAADRGLARIATLVARLRRGADVTLLFDNGDFLQGSPLGDAAAQGVGWAKGAAHPVIAVMNAMGYDAAALGNHEFSHGLAFLLEALRPARFPVLSANILTQTGASPMADRTLFPASHLMRRAVPGLPDVTVGVFGLTPPQTLQWERTHIDRPLQARDMAEAAEAHAADLRARGADVVVALCHSGIDQMERAPMQENAAALVAALPGIDALVAGHTHLLFPNPATLGWSAGIDPVKGRIQGRPVVAPGFFGSHLGVIDLGLVLGANGWRLGARRSRLFATARRRHGGRLNAMVAEDAGLSALAAPAHLATRAWTSAPIGASSTAVSSHFALIAPCETVRTVARAQADVVRRALAGGPLAGLPVLSAAAPYRAGGRGGPSNYTVLPKGPLTLRHLTELYPHPNTVAALRLTGAEVIDWLEHSASLFHQIAPGARDVALIDPSFPSFNFDSIEGLTYQIDLTAPPRYDATGRPLHPDSHRIGQVRLDGRLLEPCEAVILATNSYRLSGAGGFAADLQDRVVFLGADPSRDVLQRHIQSMPCLPPPATPNWRLVMGDGTGHADVLFDSAPAAVDHMALPGNLTLQALDQQDDGFRRFRLRL